MRDSFHLDEPKSQDIQHGTAWFAFGVALAACGWFSITTAIEGLRQLVRPESALFTAGPIAAPTKLLQELLTLRHPRPADAIVLVVAAAFPLIPLLGLLGTRPETETISGRVASLRRRMKDIAEQVESAEGLFPWAGRVTKAALFNRPRVDQRATDFQAQVRILRESIQDALGSIELPSFLHERISVRVLDMCSDMETLAFATQTRFDHQRLAGLNDCLDAVQSSELPQTVKDEAQGLLLDHFNQYHTAARRLTRAESLLDTTLGRELSENA
jgi:hypothetical protein